MCHAWPRWRLPTATHSGKWTALMIAFYFCASLALAFVVFHVSSLFLG
ncbi:MAG: hypothetical protein ACLTMP_08415 [Eggerthella lenta]